MKKVFAKQDRSARSRAWSQLFADMIEVELYLGDKAEARRLREIRSRLVKLFSDDTQAIYPPTGRGEKSAPWKR